MIKINKLSKVILTSTLVLGSVGFSSVKGNPMSNVGSSIRNFFGSVGECSSSGEAVKQIKAYSGYNDDDKLKNYVSTANAIKTITNYLNSSDNSNGYYVGPVGIGAFAAFVFKMIATALSVDEIEVLYNKVASYPESTSLTKEECEQLGIDSELLTKSVSDVCKEIIGENESEGFLNLDEKIEDFNYLTAKRNFKTLLFRMVQCWRDSELNLDTDDARALWPLLNDRNKLLYLHKRTAQFIKAKRYYDDTLMKFIKSNESKFEDTNDSKFGQAVQLYGIHNEIGKKCATIYENMNGDARASLAEDCSSKQSSLFSVAFAIKYISNVIFEQIESSLADKATLDGKLAQAVRSLQLEKTVEDQIYNIAKANSLSEAAKAVKELRAAKKAEEAKKAKAEEAKKAKAEEAKKAKKRCVFTYNNICYSNITTTLPEIWGNMTEGGQSYVFVNRVCNPLILNVDDIGPCMAYMYANSTNLCAQHMKDALSSNTTLGTLPGQAYVKMMKVRGCDSSCVNRLYTNQCSSLTETTSGTTSGKKILNKNQMG